MTPSLASPPPRRPDIDILRVSLTWGILFFHATVAYAPHPSYYIKSYGWPPGLDYLSTAWVSFMDVWQMPMFFFLSGVSAYFALFRRSEQQFRSERVHRLLVPFLVLALLNGVYSITFWAPKTVFCQAFYHGEKVNTSLPWSRGCQTFWKTTENSTFSEVCYIAKPLSHSLSICSSITQVSSQTPARAGSCSTSLLTPRSCLLTLSLPSVQAVTPLLLLWHPAHHPSPCCLLPGRLLSKSGYLRPATCHEELVVAAKWWLGGGVRLGLVPGLWIALPETFLRWPCGLCEYDMSSGLSLEAFLETSCWIGQTTLTSSSSFCSATSSPLLMATA